MPRLSDEAREERRDKILAAAAGLFSVQGFHTTSMAEIVTTSGLSAGTVYQYFSSKDDLIVAIARRALDGIGSAVLAASAAEEVPSVRDFLASVRNALPSTEDGHLRAFLILYSWAETSRSQALADLVRGRYDAMLASILPLIEIWKERGELPGFLDAEELARHLLALVQGHVVQAAIYTRQPESR